MTQYKVSKSTGVVKVNLVGYPLLAKTASCLWATDIIKLSHCSFVMLFQVPGYFSFFYLLFVLRVFLYQFSLQELKCCSVGLWSGNWLDHLKPSFPLMKPFVVLAVFWVIVLLQDEVPPIRLAAFLCKLADRMFVVDFWIHSAGKIMSYIINKD